MRVFVGYGYNDRDAWIEDHVFPILEGMGFAIAHGKEMHGQVLRDGVKERLAKSDAVIGFFTLREGQGEAAFNSHIWVRDEIVHAQTLDIPIIPVIENGVNMGPGLLGDVQYIPLDPADHLACVAELIRAVGRRNIRRIRIDPPDDLRADLWRWSRDPQFAIRYRTQAADGTESPPRDGRLELVDQGFYLNVSDIPPKGFVDVEGTVGGEPKFGSGWVSADAVQVPVMSF